MALLTLCAVATEVDVIGFMAAVAGGGCFIPRLLGAVAGPAGNVVVAAVQGEVGVAVIELHLIPAVRVVAAGAVFTVAPGVYVIGAVAADATLILELELLANMTTDA